MSVSNLFVSILHSRWRSLFLVGCAYLGLSLIFRIFLIFYSWSEIVNPEQIFIALMLGLLYDLAFLCFFATPFSLFNWLLPDQVYNTRAMHFVRLFLMSIILSGCFFLFVAEWFFWDEFTSRFNFISVDYLIYRREVTENIYQSYPVIPITILCVLMGLLCTAFFSKVVALNAQINQTFASRAIVTISNFALAALIVFSLNQDARQFSNNRQLVEIASNGPYQFFAAFRNNTLDFDAFYATLPEVEAQRLFQSHFQLADSVKNFSPKRDIIFSNEEKHLNIILVTIESLSASFMAHFGNTEGLTPNLDALAEDSLFFSQLYATGSRTTRGLEALSLSLPPTPGRSLVKRPDQPARYNIGTEFKNRNYDISFLYGGYAYFDHMSEFFSNNGFKVIDRQNFESNETAFDTAWGVADEYLYEQTIIEADKRHQQGKPFLSFLLTTSNHRPYLFPADRIDLPPGSRNSVIKYTDWAIGDFLKKAKLKPWFDDTVFIFVADHAASSAGRKNLSVIKHHIPLLIYSPKHINAKHIPKVMSQIDIAPTLLGLLNFNYTSEFVGSDVLNDADYRERALIGNYEYLGLYQDDTLTYLKPKKEIILDMDPLVTEKEFVITKEDARAKNVISIYQAADRIISQNLTERLSESNR